MHKLLILSLVVLVFAYLFFSFTKKREVQAVDAITSVSPLDLVVTDVNGQPVDLRKYKGQVVLIVNTASKCGFTAQYKGLEELYEKYHAHGLVVLAFPSNDFGNQEPGTDEEIKSFCQTNFGVTFPVFAKSIVKGSNKQELFKNLTEKSPEDLRGEIRWNFEKFLIDRNGKLRMRFSSFTTPMSETMVGAVKKLLAEER